LAISLTSIQQTKKIGNIEAILGGPFIVDDVVISPETELHMAMVEEGYNPPEDLRMDGEIHRFSANGQRGDDAGWYVAYADGIPASKFGDWRTGREFAFRGDMGRQLTMAENLAITARMEEAMKKRDQERKKKNEVASVKVQMIWDDAQPAGFDHPYLVKKQVKPHGVRILEDGRLILPLFNKEGQLMTLQYIDVNGVKRYHPGGQAGGCGWILGDLSSSGKVFVAEGFATGASIRETTGRPVAIAYSAGNLMAMTGIIREKCPRSSIVIVADNDESGVGLQKAEEASRAYQASVVMPPDVGTDANDFVRSGGDLKALLGESRKRMVFAEELMAVPSPISWLVRGWVQDKALVMIHGPSGSGKSFVVIDWMCSITSGIGSWLGKDTKTGDVIYLCGEGHYGLSARLNAWEQEHQAKVSGAGRLAISTGASDLDNLNDLNQVIQDIVDTGVSPKLIVIDTLNRFLAGDENSAKDTRAFLDACGTLMQEFNCTVLIVHHTGLNPEAQNRARGSSAWKGALDIEINVKSVARDALTLSQTKAKDSEQQAPISLELKQVPLPGWFDDAGQQITSAVIAPGGIPDEKVNDSVLRHSETFIEAWEKTGCMLQDGDPYITRELLKNYLLTEGGVNPETVRKVLNPNQDNRMISILINAGIIEQRGPGFAVIDDFTYSLMMLRNQGK
jgi:phage/plasmid primase-like uncharacterized protein